MRNWCGNPSQPEGTIYRRSPRTRSRNVAPGTEKNHWRERQTQYKFAICEGTSGRIEESIGKEERRTTCSTSSKSGQSSKEKQGEGSKRRSEEAP